MTKEEKAKAYDGALEWMREIYPTMEGSIKEDAEHFFPELTDSEDERIRKEMIDYFSQFKEDGIRGVDITPWIVYLERQKEHKPAEKLSKEEYVKKFKALCDAYEIKLPNREYDIYGLCEDLHKLFGDIQNPAEWSEDTIRKAIEEVGLTQHQINWFKNNVFPPKQEWSEEDKVMLNNIIWSVHMKSIIKPLYEMDDRSRYKKYEDFLKALPERFNLQPRTEWSEEDEKMRQHIISDLREFRDCEVDTELVSVYEDEIAWLKSLRSQPHWKPSKKQMMALGWKINNTPIGAWQRKELESIYKELKKL